MLNNAENYYIIIFTIIFVRKIFLKKLFKTAALLLSAVILFSICGCGGEEYEQTVYADIGEKISTLDPQLVTAMPDRTVVLNIFEGLTRLDEDGNPILAAANRYEQNGNTYTFYLKDDLFWEDDTPLTAYDFLFAFRRAADAKTAAPDFESIACIAGAESVRAGKSIDCLGVTAVDDKTISITLSYDDGTLLYTLAKPICMPCNQEFFTSTNGTYGRDGDSILANGAYRLHSWNTEKYSLRLKRNALYKGTANAIPAAILITSNEDRITALTDGDIDAALVSTTDTAKLTDGGLTVDKYFNRYWFIAINKDAQLGTFALRQALATSINRKNLEARMPEYALLQDCIFPLDVSFDGTKIYDTLCDSTYISYDSDTAYKNYSSSVSAETAPLSIIYSDSDGVDDIVSDIAAGWQKTLGCFLNISPLDSNESVLSAVENGNYTVAFFSLEAVSDNAYDFLQNFKSGNRFAFSNAKFDTAIGSLPSCADITLYTETLKTAQDILLSDYSIIPIAATPTVLCHSTDISSVTYNIRNDSINFGNIIKKP